MKTFYVIYDRYLLLIFLVYSLTTVCYSQTCPSLPEGYCEESFNGWSNEYLLPCVVPSDSSLNSARGKTIRYFIFSNRNITDKESVINITLPEGVNKGKVNFNRCKLSFDVGTLLNIFAIDIEAGKFIDNIIISNFPSKVSQQYIVEGNATIAFYGNKSDVIDDNIIRFVTDSREAQAAVSAIPSPPTTFIMDFPSIET
jgi:hypothetical protein